MTKLLYVKASPRAELRHRSSWPTPILRRIGNNMMSKSRRLICGRRICLSSTVTVRPPTTLVGRRTRSRCSGHSPQPARTDGPPQ